MAGWEQQINQSHPGVAVPYIFFLFFPSGSPAAPNELKVPANKHTSKHKHINKQTIQRIAEQTFNIVKVFSFATVAAVI